MIKSLSIHHFRNIRHLELHPKAINVITGKRSSGKTSLLESIAFADSNDSEFFSILHRQPLDPLKTLDLKQLIELNFFSHQKDLESFKIKVEMMTKRNRLLEIWKTNDDFARMLGVHLSKYSPYIFVYDSADLRKLFPRCVHYSKVDKVYKELKKHPFNWPTHYIGTRPVLSFTELSRRYRILSNQIVFWKAIQSFTNFFDDIENIRYDTKPVPQILIKLNHLSEYIPFQCCSNSLIRALSILIISVSTIKPYLLIDDIEYGLTDREQEWLIGTLSQIALDRNIQLFVTSKHPETLNRFLESAGTKHYRVQSVDMDQLVQKEHQDLPAVS